MGLSLERRFERYCDGIVSVLAHADHEQLACWYIKWLMLPSLPAVDRLSDLGVQLLDMRLIGSFLLLTAAENTDRIIQYLAPPIVDLVGVSIKLFG